MLLTAVISLFSLTDPPVANRSITPPALAVPSKVTSPSLDSATIDPPATTVISGSVRLVAFPKVTDPLLVTAAIVFSASTWPANSIEPSSVNAEILLTVPGALFVALTSL